MRSYRVAQWHELEVLRGAAMPVTRTYECNECRERFEVTCASGDGDPDCPHCAVVLQWKPQRFAIGGSPVMQAEKIAQDIIENDFGMSNIKDAKYEGETAYVAPTTTTAESDKLSQQMSEVVQQRPQLSPMAKQFFQGGAASFGNVDLGALKAGPSAGATGARALNMIQNAAQEGRLGPICKPIVRG